MNNSNYMVSVDENGQPYISHADGIFSKARQAGAKYYQKIKTAYGTRYFYDPEEWKAYVEGRSNKPNSLLGKAMDKLGVDERKRYKNAKDQFMDAYKADPKSEKTRELASKTHDLNGDYNNTLLGKAENFAKDAKSQTIDRFQRMKDEFKNSKSQFSEYDENDPDFSDENYEKAERIGDSDFVYFVRSDGHPVILEEDMKWVLPKGTDMTSPAFQDMVKQQENMWHYQTGTMANHTWPSADERHKAWTSSVTNMINEAVKASRKK
jgi:hypothetical protein